ncbi:MAG: carboxymuconolactone decarboxylase family protein [Desulfurivibrionaceae bacterium]
MTDRLAREAGITSQEIVALSDYRKSDIFTDLEKDILSYAEAMTSTPARVSDDLFRRLSEQLSPEQLVELTAAIALENFSARFNRAFEIEPGG